MEVHKKIQLGHISIPLNFSRGIGKLVKKILKTYQSKRLGVLLESVVPKGPALYLQQYITHPSIYNSFTPRCESTLVPLKNIILPTSLRLLYTENASNFPGSDGRRCSASTPPVKLTKSTGPRTDDSKLARRIEQVADEIAG